MGRRSHVPITRETETFPFISRVGFHTQNSSAAAKTEPETFTDAEQVENTDIMILCEKWAV